MEDIDRDRFMTPAEAVDYGLIDGVMARARSTSTGKQPERRDEDADRHEGDDQKRGLVAVQRPAEDERAHQPARGTRPPRSRPAGAGRRGVEAK